MPHPQPNWRRSPSPFIKQLKRVPGHGPVPARVMLIGEKPGRTEAERGLPFIGPSGKWMDTFLSVANVPRSTIFVTNVVREFTEYSKPTAAEITRDHDDLVGEILMCEPEIIGLVGTWAVENVLHIERAEMDRTHGVPIRVPALFGGELPRDGGWICLPITHPASCEHSPDSAPIVLDDFLQLGRLLDGEISVREPDPWLGREHYEEFVGDELDIYLPAGVDTEGSREHPWCITISTEPGKSLLVRPGTRVRFHDRVWLHNALWDLGVLRVMGVEFEDGQVRDTMIHAYNLCIEPQGLKPLLYRHCAMLQDDYADIVGEANREHAMQYLYDVALRDWPAVEPYIIEVGGIPKVKKPWNINRRVEAIIRDVVTGKVDKDGKLTDARKRWAGIDDFVREPVEAVMGPMPSATLDDVPWEVAKHYACRDSDGEIRVAPIMEQKLIDMGLEEVSKVDHDILPMLDAMQENGIALAPPEFWNGIETQCESQMAKAKWRIFQLTGADINPGSGDQVAELLYDKLGLTPPKYTDSGERGSVNALCLETLLGENPVVQHIMDYTEASKIRGTYVLPLRKLCLLGDHRTRSTIRSTRTTTGRLAMADPPLHQIPIMTELGRQLRGGFIAEPGHVLYDIDVDQLEMRIMAHDSRDAELCRLFHEGRDIHAETACSIFSVPMSSLSVDGRTGKVNDYRRIVAKHAAFGIINGITEHGIVNYMIINRCRRPDGEPWTLDDCVVMRAEWFKKYKGVARFHRDCMEETRQTGLARETIGGRIIYLPQVWSQNKKVRESAERMSYVMHTQGGGQSMIKKVMAVVWKGICRLQREIRPLLQMHDELLFELPDDERMKLELDRMATRMFCETVKLRVPVKASGGYGGNWLTAH